MSENSQRFAIIENDNEEEPEDLEELEIERLQRENAEADIADAYYEDKKLND
ncbi:MAG TPA: hypothetical protein VIK86_06395 [Candidatus Paceibacterota bacterium]